MPGYVTPPAGLTPPDFSIQCIPPQEVPLPPGLPVSPLYQPPMGRATSLRAAIDRQAQAMRAMVPQAPMLLAPKSQATAAGSSGGATLVPATPILRESAGNPIPAGGAATK